MVNELIGKVAIVTGGALGIGAGIVEKFVAEGARVVIADIERDRGRSSPPAGRRRDLPADRRLRSRPGRRAGRRVPSRPSAGST